MILQAPMLRRENDETVLESVLISENGGPPPLRARIAVAREYEDYLDRTATPFVPAAITLATAAGEDLRIQGPVSDRIVRGAERASRLYSEWWGHRPASIDANGATAAENGAGPGVGLFYSRGIDSSATLLRSLEGSIPERVTHLLSFGRFSRRYSDETVRLMWADTVRAAAEYGLPLIRLETDVDRPLRERMGWGESFGAVLAGGALALGPLLSEMLVGATVDDDHPRPRGSHPELDRLWSTERTSFRQDATELGKMGRIELVSRHPIALRHLKVCWEADTSGNCGRCSKCLRTMTGFAQSGGDDWGVAFDAPLTPEQILACDVAPSERAKVPAEVLGRLRPELAEIEWAWAENMRRQERRDAWTRRRRRVRRLRRMPPTARKLRRRSRRRLRRSSRLVRHAVGAALGR